MAPLLYSQDSNKTTMQMEFSMTRQLSSKIPDRAPQRVSTQQIKAGLERIKKAQQQVLLQLKKNHMDYSIDVRNTNSQVLRQKKQQNQGLTKELLIEREKSTEKSTLYRRRVVDLESSLQVHEQNEMKLRLQNRQLEEQLRELRARYGDLERDYEKLVGESEVSGRNLRGLEKQVMELMKKTQDEDPRKLRAEFDQINSERNVIMTQKVALLKKNSKLESQNIELKTKIAQLMEQKQSSPVLQPQAQYQYHQQDLTTLLSQIHKINTAHEYIFNSYKSNTKLPRAVIDKENMYQNSLNRILQMLNTMQRDGMAIGDSGTGLEGFRFDHETSFREEVNRIETQLLRKHKKQLTRYAAERDQLSKKNLSKQRELTQLQHQLQMKQQKISQLRRQKSKLMQQVTDLTTQLHTFAQNQQKTDNKKLQLELKKQKSKDEQYRTIIQQLNEQMLTIQRQKKDLDGLIRGMVDNKSEEEGRNKKKLGEILEENQMIKDQNEKMKGKYEAIFVQKENMYLALNQVQMKNNNLQKQVARQVLQKQKLMAQLTKLKQQYQVSSLQVHKYKLLSQNTKKDSENVNNSYLLQIERLIQQGLGLRHEIEHLLKDRNQLRQLKGRYGLLVKDNQILGMKARHVNGQVDHLWAIKEVEYQNVNRVLTDLKPL